MAESRVAELLLRIKTAGEEAIERLGDAFDAVKEIGMAAFAAISAIVVQSLDAYREQEEAVNALTQSMINQGVYSKELKQEYLDQASALQLLSTYGDEQIVNAQAVLQAYLGQEKVTKELVQATMDLATVKKMDLASAAELVGKSIGTATNALARNGIEVDTNATKAEKLAQVVDALNDKFGGQAEAATQGLGVLSILKNLVGELFEEIGARLSPVIQLFAGKIIQLATDTSVTTPIIEGFIWSLKILTQAGVLVAGIFEYTSKVIGAYLGGAIGAISQALEGKFAQAWETAKGAVVSGGEAFTTTYANTVARLKEVDAAFLANKAEVHAKEEEMIRQSGQRKKEIRAEQAIEEQNLALEAQIQQQQLDIQLLEAGEENRARILLQHRIKQQEQILKTTNDANRKLAAQQEIHELNEQQKQLVRDQKMVEARKQTLATISTLQNSNNQQLAAIGKAAAITQIAIETPVAIARALAAFPPPFNFAAAGLVGAAMAAQAAQIAGVKLAEGGIVQARPGGIQATIGEGGQDEAVIPLDRAGEFGFGGGGRGSITVNVYGGLLGDAASARELAKAIDEELLKLRQNNESVAFDSGVV